MSFQQRSAEQRITRARVALMRDVNFIALSGILMTGSWCVKDGQGTAATNGRDEVYYRGFVDGLDNMELAFLVAHEAYHKLFRHRQVWKKIKTEQPQIANMAMDYVINGMLDHQAKMSSPPIIKFIKGGCLDHQYDGMDTLQVYKLLMQQAQQGGKPQGGSLDDHEFDNDEGDDLPPLTEEEEQLLEQQVDQALRQAATVAGKLGGNLDRSLKDLLEPEVPWQQIMQEFVTTNCVGSDYSTWRKPSRRWLGRDMYMPSTQTDATQEVVLTFDTSGSISDASLRRGLSEAFGIAKAVNPQKIHVLYWDTEVAGHEVYEGDDVAHFTERTKAKGGGGTYVGSVNEYLKKHNIKPDCIVHFSDGYVETDWGGNSWPAPVLWCLTTKGLTAPTGKTVYIRDM